MNKLGLMKRNDRLCVVKSTRKNSKWKLTVNDVEAATFIDTTAAANFIDTLCRMLNVQENWRYDDDVPDELKEATEES